MSVKDIPVLKLHPPGSGGTPKMSKNPYFGDFVKNVQKCQKVSKKVSRGPPVGPRERVLGVPRGYPLGVGG
jgi:hypothetical protein